ncbi:MAG: hypothetical protein RIR18_784 [Pseudomonadota bacterium]|jgi:disulfide bond formation protein DsbB
MVLFRKTSDRSIFLTLAIGALAIDAGGFALQTFLKLSPCPLCIFQRVLYLVLLALGLLGTALPFRIIHRGLGWAVLLTSLIGFATAAYQSWMQAFPEKFTSSCSYTDPNLIEQFVDWLGMIEPTLFMATGLCTSKAWDFLGLSMVNWSLLTFSLITFIAIWRLSRR